MSAFLKDSPARTRLAAPAPSDRMILKQGSTTQQTSFMVAVIGRSIAVLGQALAETPEQACLAVGAMFVKYFAQEATAQCVDTGAMKGTWIEGDPDYVRGFCAAIRKRSLEEGHPLADLGGQVIVPAQLEQQQKVATSQYNCRALIERAALHAASGSGLSDLLFETRLQAAYKAILDEAPVELRPAIEGELLDRGFDPHHVADAVGPGRCSMTGIDEDCCPCGYHL